MTIRNITTILFDFDGVIADTESGRYEAYSDIFEEYGYDLRSRCSVSDLAGFTGDGFMSRYFPEIPADRVKEIVRKRQTHYMKHLDRFCIPYPGMRQTLADLKRRGYHPVLTTANATAAARILIETAGVADYFDAVCGREICEDPVTKVKDYSRVPQQIGRTIDECVVVEDSPVGVAGAKRAGFYCIAFERYEDAALREQADVIVYDYNDLRRLFDLPPIHLSPPGIHS